MDLTAENVQAVFTDSLARNPETAAPLRVRGVFDEVIFNKTRLHSYTTEVRGFLGRLSTRFYTDRGGGHSYFAMDTRRDAHQWGGRPDIERLLTLGLGLGLATFCLERHRWHLFPESVPYVRLSGDLFKLWATFRLPSRGAGHESASVTQSFEADAHPAPLGVSEQSWYHPAAFEIQDLGDLPTHVAASFYNRVIIDGFFDDSLPSWILDPDTILEVY